MTRLLSVERPFLTAFLFFFWTEGLVRWSGDRRDAPLPTGGKLNKARKRALATVPTHVVNLNLAQAGGQAAAQVSSARRSNS